MLFRVITLITLSLSSNLFAQNSGITRHGTPRNGYTVFYGKDRPEKGYPPKAKVEEGLYKNDRREGEWKFYYPDGKIKLIGNYENNRPWGAYKKFYDNGQLKEEGEFIKSQMRDTLRRYYKTGVLEYVAFFDSLGREDGIVKYYHRNGSLELVYTAERGRIASELQRYDENGILINENDSVDRSNIVYVTDLFLEKKTAPKLEIINPEGYNLVLNENGEKDQEGEFKNGLLFKGKRFIYSEDGILIEIELYMEGYLHSYGQIK